MNNPIKKGVVVSVILLFISVSIVPTTGTRVSFDDITPPVTTCTLNPPEPNGNNSWYVSDVEVTLNATDDMSGVNVTQYRINGGSIKMYTEPFNVTVDGQHTVEYRSIDYAGNIEDWKSVEFKIDQTGPIVDITYEMYGNPITGWKFITFAYCDDYTSGVERVEFYHWKWDGYFELYIDFDEPYEWESNVFIKGECSVKGLIFFPWFYDEYVSFFVLFTKMYGDEFGLTGFCFDNAGNSEFDTLHCMINNTYNYMFQRFTFLNNYSGKIGLFFIDAVFEDIPIEEV